MPDETPDPEHGHPRTVTDFLKHFDQVFAGQDFMQIRTTFLDSLADMYSGEASIIEKIALTLASCTWNYGHAPADQLTLREAKVNAAFSAVMAQTIVAWNDEDIDTLMFIYDTFLARRPRDLHDTQAAEPATESVM